jgi:hypothetical protein
VYCDIAQNLDEQKLEQIRELERRLGLTVVAFSCRSLDPEREEKLRQMAAQLGPVLQAEPAAPNDDQLALIKEEEDRLGLSLVAVRE